MIISVFRRAAATLLLSTGLWSMAHAACQFAKVAEMPVQWSANGQPLVGAEINGKPVSMLFDTGSNWTVLTRQGAEAHGLSISPGSGYAYGVGGVSSNMAAEVKEFVLGAARNKNIQLWVMGSAELGSEIVGLVGADYSMQMNLEVALADNAIRFFRTIDCDNAYLGYWDKDALEVPLDWPGSFDKRPFVTVELNGKKVVALVDTGASVSAVYRRTAKLAGVDVNDAQAAGLIGGIGDHKVKMWPARFDFKLGDEVVKNVKMTVIDERSDSSDDYSGMLLGQDWLRAHRVLFVRSQKRMIFSYLGGAVFSAP
ncbi:aspartyl protease family protein [Duganella sp. Dugasp56]|uniref:aspartyl protease family protein n=1 Tax=Duganella sp. Dugasp56 TaxID=3243046 RepID=UPI0039AF3194